MAVVPKRLNELKQNSRDAIVTALVITKTDPKYFLVKKRMEFRGVITFTLRDAKYSVCNCKFWGSKEQVDIYNRTMKIGDVINVVCPTIVLSNNFYKDDNQRVLPISTLPILLIVNDGGGSLQLNDYQNVEFLNRLQELMYIPHKPLSDALRLSDIRFSYSSVVGSEAMDAKGIKMPSQSVDLLVLVGEMRPAKEIIRADEMAQCIEVVVFDESITDGMLLSIWQTAWIQRAQENWEAMKTVLHLIDVNIVDSGYHKCCILRKTQRTVIYENPLGKEANALRAYVSKMPPRSFQMVGQSRRMEVIPNPDDIRTQMTVKQIYQRLDSIARNDVEEFTAVLYGMVTQFNIDGFSPIVGRICKSCQRILGVYKRVCDSDKCRTAFPLSQTDDRFDYYYNVNIHFADHTGCLIETRLTDTLAADIFQMSAENFKQYYFNKNEKELLSLKWRYLFQRFEVKLCIKRATTTRRRPALLVIAMEPIHDLHTIANNIMVC